MALTKPEAVRLLLLSHLDYLPSVHGARMDSAPGPQASSYVTCPTCAGCGRLIGADEPCMVCLTAKKEGRRLRRRNHGCRLCLACDGRGERKRRGAEEGEYGGVKISELEQAIVGSATSNGQKRARAALSLSEGLDGEFYWVRERERYRANGSYAELDCRLQALRAVNLPRYEQLMHYVTSHDDPLWEWSESAQREIDYTIRALARTMPDKIRVPGWIVRREKEAA